MLDIWSEICFFNKRDSMDQMIITLRNFESKLQFKKLKWEFQEL